MIAQCVRDEAYGVERVILMIVIVKPAGPNGAVAASDVRAEEVVDRADCVNAEQA
jgi:hypothetical protein